MENNNIEKYIENINKYHNQFIVLQNISYFDKIAINDNNVLFLQKKTPWRYFIRKIKKQNRDRFSEYLSTNINEYIKNIDILINIYECGKDNNIKKILENIIIFITSILGGIVSLRNYIHIHNIMILRHLIITLYFHYVFLNDKTHEQ